ncbi:MAG TPA: hypothetical protein P5089_02460 [Candidatus Portnoybacteria bacterium]|nr:hypothetical protein [Candidatus Portnoybacteria bacterium]
MKIDRKKITIIVGIELSLALIFFIGADWASESVHRFFHSYFADIALPFGFYFLLIPNEDTFLFLRPWHNKALSVFLLVSTSEMLQYFGIYALATVFDPIDFVMYAGGVLLAALVDTKLISKYYPAMHLANRF